MSNGTEQYQVSQNDTSNNYNLTAGDICNHKTFNETYSGTTSLCMFTKYVQNVYLLRMQVFHLVGWLWGANFIIAFTECSLAGAFASYYWAFNKPKVGRRYIFIFFCNVLLKFLDYLFSLIYLHLY